MTIYATLAAALIFGPRDRVWTVLSPPNLIREGLFHLPPGTRDQVILVDLPSCRRACCRQKALSWTIPWP